MRTLTRRSSLYRPILISILLILYCALIQVFAIKHGLSVNPAGPVPMVPVAGSGYEIPDDNNMGSLVGGYERLRWEEVRRAQFAAQFPLVPMQYQPLQP